MCVYFEEKNSAALLPAAFTFSFGQVSRTGDEATDGALSSTLDIAVPIVTTIINPPNNLLSDDTIVVVSVSGGNATCMSIRF